MPGSTIFNYLSWAVLKSQEGRESVNDQITYNGIPRPTTGFGLVYLIPWINYGVHSAKVYHLQVYSVKRHKDPNLE